MVRTANVFFLQCAADFGDDERKRECERELERGRGDLRKRSRPLDGGGSYTCWVVWLQTSI
jgi:hypothetical protein